MNNKGKFIFPWDVVGYVVFACLIVLLGGIIGTFTSGFAVSAIFGLLSSAIPAYTNEIINSYTKFAAFLGIWVILFIYAKAYKKSSIKELWFCGEKKGWKSLLLGVLIGGVMCSFAIGVAALLGELNFTYFSFDLVTLVPIILFGLVQSSAEELVFRGFMLQGLMKKRSVILSIILSSVTFGLVHLGNSGITVLAILNIAMLGAIFAVAVVKWNSLSAAIGMHFMWNFTEQILFGTPNSGSVYSKPILRASEANTSLLYHQKFGIEASVQTFVVCAIVVALMLIVANKKGLDKH